MGNGAYEGLCELAAARGWRVAIHASEEEDLRTLAVWMGSPAAEDSTLVEALVIPDAASLDWTATQILAAIRVRP